VPQYCAGGTRRPAELAGCSGAGIDDIRNLAGKAGNTGRIAIEDFDPHDIGGRDAPQLVADAFRLARQAFAIDDHILRCLSQSALALVISTADRESGNPVDHVERVAGCELREIGWFENLRPCGDSGRGGCGCRGILRLRRGMDPSA